MFAVECGYRPDDVYDMAWSALIRLTLFMDDVMDERRRANDQARSSSSQGSFRPMT